jgi:acetyl/propionyl-CoA carboxylase alpha subunit
VQPKYVVENLEHLVTPLRRGREITVAVDGRVLNAHVHWRGPNECELTVNGAVHRVYCAQDDRKIFLHIDGKVWLLTALDEFRGTGSRPDIVRGAVIAPMPGVVIAVNVEEGQRVTTGEALILIESMKLQCELRAQGNGVVSRVAVGVGAGFERGAVLIEIDAEQGEGA